MAHRIPIFPNEFDAHISAKIVERQSSFVRFVTQSSVEYKVSYIEKYEYLIEELDFVGFDITEDHPILEHYQQDKIDIYLSSKVENPREIIEEFEVMVKSEYKGWRNLQECFNGGGDLLISILEGGYGILYSGPEVLARKVENVLQKSNIKYKSLPKKAKNKPQLKALIMGDNIVVAKNFKIERI